MSLKVTFYGGAEKVTGSNFLITGEKGKILIDCGVEQGADVSVAEMYGPFPYDPKTIDALVVTHAHLDHVGRIPKLVKEGFCGKIFSTAPTRDLAELILRDSLDILARDAQRRGKGTLYTLEDLERTLSLWETLPYHEEREINGLSVYLSNTG